MVSWTARTAVARPSASWHLTAATVSSMEPRNATTAPTMARTVCARRRARQSSICRRRWYERPLASSHPKGEGVGGQVLASDSERDFVLAVGASEQIVEVVAIYAELLGWHSIHAHLGHDRCRAQLDAEHQVDLTSEGAVADLAGVRAQDLALVAKELPVAHQREVVGSQMARRCVPMLASIGCSCTIGERRPSARAKVRFRRHAQIGRLCVRGEHAPTRLVAKLREQAANGGVDRFVLAFTEVGVANHALGINEIFGWPIVIVESFPSAKIVVLRDGIAELVALDGVGHVGRALFEHELRRVYANDDEGLVVVFRPKRAHVRKGPHAVDAAIGPEIDEHHLAPKLGQS